MRSENARSTKYCGDELCPYENRLIWGRWSCQMFPLHFRSIEVFGVGGRRLAADECGFAIPAVIFASAMIAILALSLNAFSRSIATANSTFVADAEASAWNDSGLTRALSAYARPEDPMRQLLSADGRRVPWRFHGRTLLLSMQAESGKLDLNAGDIGHISKLLSETNLSSSLKKTLVDRIAVSRQNGVFIDRVANILPAFERMSEQRDEVERYFTTFTRQVGLDMATAPRLAIETMPGISPMLAGEILQTRDSGGSFALINLPADVARRFVPQRPIYTFTSETSDGFSKSSAKKAVVTFDERNQMSVLSWGVAGVIHSTVEKSGPYRTF
ncbi:hypothetical protein OAO01_07215 [Oligoflexia bacterium]|nr:hypothetical protein [Oligoflexia bacterium]